MDLHDCSGLENIPGAEETVLPKECQQISSSNKNVTTCSPSGGGGVLPEKLGGGVRPALQNPLPYLLTKSANFPLQFITGQKKVLFHIYGRCGRRSCPKHTL